MHPNKQQLALDFVRRGIRGVQQAELTLARYISLARQYGCDPDEIAVAAAPPPPLKPGSVCDR